jgi:CspA family cold shock protein
MGGGPDAFAHFSAIQAEGFKTLKEGARVEFELAEGAKGMMAMNIRTGPNTDTSVEITNSSEAETGP